MTSLDEVREALSDNNVMITAYIEKIEAENEALELENENLRQANGEVLEQNSRLKVIGSRLYQCKKDSPMYKEAWEEYSTICYPCFNFK